MATPVLNTELVLEAPQQIPDGGGGFRTVWAPIGTLWADVKPRSARETAIGGRAASEVTHRIVIRSAPEGSPRRPTPDCRFRSGGRVFSIRGVAPEGARGKFLTCWAEEGLFA